MANREKTRTVFIELINLQLAPHNKTYEDVANEQDWYMKYNTTRDKEAEFIETAINILRTKLRMSKSVAEKEINWFILQWGLTTNESHAELDDMFVNVEKTIVKKNKK